MLITKIAAIMLVHTGMSRQSAQFQARSAYTGVGFTTSEAENVVNHPLRRKIIMALMLIGNAGIISAMASLMLTFVGQEESQFSWPLKLIVLILSLFLLWLVASSQYVNNILSRVINKALKKYTSLIVSDYQTLLHLSGGFSITELLVEEGDWLVNKKLKNAQLREEGLNVLGIQRADGVFNGVLTGETVIKEDNILLIYGKEDVIKRLDSRKNDFFGDMAHETEVQQYYEESQTEREKEKGST